MKNIILLLVALGLISCAKSVKNNEEIQYYNFNERQKAVVQKDDIYLTKVTKSETLSGSLSNISSKKNSKLIGSWDFSQNPSKTLKGEIEDKAVELGANHIVLFEKKNCEDIDMTTYEIKSSEKSHCYRIWYYQVPEDMKKVILKPAINALPKSTTPKVETIEVETPKVEISKVETLKESNNITNDAAIK